MSIRSAIESLYKDTCNVYERRECRQPNGSTIHKDVCVLENIPCRISYSSSPATDNNDKNATVSQNVKLFISPDKNIKPGRKVEVTRCGIATMYRASGEPAIYSTHKEINLELWELTS